MLEMVLSSSIAIIFVGVALFVAVKAEQNLKGTAVFKSRDIRLTGTFALPVIILVTTWQIASNIYRLINEQNVNEKDPVQFAQPVTLERGTYSSEIIAQVRLSPATQLIPKASLLELDRNQFIINEEISVAVKRPVNIENWDIGIFPDIETIGMLDIPGVADSLRILPFQPEIYVESPIFGIRSTKIYNVVIDQGARIQDLPILFNPLKDPEVAKQLLAYFTDAIRQYAETAEEEIDPENAQEMAKSYLDNETGRQDEENVGKLPTSKNIQNGVFVASFSPEHLNNYLMNRLIPRRNLLERS